MMNPLDHKVMDYDLVVCGGGIPGVCAAISAARAGIQVALVEQRPLLGGNSSSLALVPPHGAATMWHNRNAREGGLLEEFVMEYARRSPFADNRRIWDQILEEACRAEPLLDLYLNTRLDGAEIEDGQIKSVQLTQSSTEQSFCMNAPLFVDGTGDAYLAHAVGAKMRHGREGKAEFGETLAPDEGDDKTLPSALYVIAHRREHEAPFIMPDSAKEHVSCDDFPHRPHDVSSYVSSKALTEDGSAIQLFWWFSLGGERDTIKDSEEIYVDLVNEAMGVWDHLKNHCTPETREAVKNYEAVWWSPFPLRRESRRVQGDYTLKEGDIFEARLFDDRVAYGGWPVDIHPPEGIYSDKPPCDQTFVNELYSLPFRMMYSETVDNLLLVGRCVSASHVAMGSVRVMHTLGAAAQAVGLAAAICKDKGVLPRALGDAHMPELQQKLLKADCHLIRLANDDPDDLARQARVSATSELVSSSGEGVGWLDLRYDTAQQVPVCAGPLTNLSLLLKSRASGPVAVNATLYSSAVLGRFDDRTPLATHQFTIEPGEESWLDWPLDLEIAQDGLLWIVLDASPDVSWGYSDQELFGSRFAVRFEGDLESPPHHGAARVAPMPDDWFPINHNGRLPAELHSWAEETVGIAHERKVRAMLAHRISPAQAVYGARNVTNGISRAEDWPNLWISNPTEALPQALTLEWNEPHSLNEIRLTFDTDLDAPERFYGWPREAHRFSFPVPQCAKDYRLMGLQDGQWIELLSVTGNYDRHRVHRLENPARCEAIRIEVLATHGDPSARIFEVRVY